MNVSEYIVDSLGREGVEVVFGYPGGAIMPLYDALVESPIRHILVRHEQAAALAADGYARVTGQVGVCLATSGPGITNLITGIANAYLDSVPMLVITGQVSTNVMGTDAFQEVDTLGLSLSIVKHSFLVRSAEELVAILPEAFAIARSDRPGPVLIDLPKDVALTELAGPVLVESWETAPPEMDFGALDQAKDLLLRAQRPLLYVGGGVGKARAVTSLRRFVEHSAMPGVTTLQGIGALPGDHPLNLGMLGMHGFPAANLAVQECDLLMVVGARFDDRATGKLDSFAPEASVIHLDIDPAELGKLRRPTVSLRVDLRQALDAMAMPLSIEPWRRWCAKLKEDNAWKYPPSPRLEAPAFIRRLSDRASPSTIVCCDVGQHQMWVAQHYSFDSPNRHLSSGGLGTMGFGIPAGIGAWLGSHGQEVIVVTGDGSVMMNIQELATLNRYGIPLKIIVLDNQRLGMVHQWQKLFFEKRFSETLLEDNPDFVKVAESFGVAGRSLADPNEVDQALDALLGHDGPFLLHVLMDPQADVWPLVPPGKSNRDMMYESKASKASEPSPTRLKSAD